MFATVAAVNGGYEAGGTSHTINLPSGIAAGDLLLVILSGWHVGGGECEITFPGGWTELFETRVDNIISFAAAYRIADGGEGATITVAFNPIGDTNSAHTSYRITGFSGVPEVGTTTTSKSTYPDPPNLTPTWGAKDTLWIACCGYKESNNAVSSYPTNYTDGRNDRWDSIYGVGVGSARRELNTASENPGTFTIAGSVDWMANTIAINPASYIGFHTATAQRRYKAVAYSGFTFPDPAGSGFSSASDGYYMVAGLSLSGILSLEAFGVPNVGRQTLLPDSIISLEAFGTPKLNFIIFPSGILSAEAFGTLTTILYLLPSGIVSAETVGEPKVIYIITATGIPSAETFGTAKLNFVIFPSGIISAEAFGNMVVSKPLLFIQRYTIEIHNAAGDLLAVLKDTYGIILEEKINAPTTLTFMSRADDDKLTYLTRANEIWVRDVENDTILAKMRLERSEDTR